MTGAVMLRPDDLRFINLVAVRRFGGPESAAQSQGLEAALDAVQEQTPYARSARLAGELLSRKVFSDAPLPTALLAMVTQLERDGLQLLAPQGAMVGMVHDLATGAADVNTLARWLQDRAVPSSSTG